MGSFLSSPYCLSLGINYRSDKDRKNPTHKDAVVPCLNWGELSECQCEPREYQLLLISGNGVLQGVHSTEWECNIMDQLPKHKDGSVWMEPETPAAGTLQRGCFLLRPSTLKWLLLEEI